VWHRERYRRAAVSAVFEAAADLVAAAPGAEAEQARHRQRLDGGPDTEEAYRVAHDWRAELERGLAEPDPAHAAAAWLPVAIQLEHAVDAVAATDGDRAALLALLADPAPVPTPAQASRLLARVVAALPYRETL
jgi:hypothetical protein